MKFFNSKLQLTQPNSQLTQLLKTKYDNNWHPIDFKSRSCTSAEQNYCHLERQPLAIAFACLKFNEYLYDQKFIVESEKYSKCPDTSDTTQNPMIYHVSKKKQLCGKLNPWKRLYLFQSFELSTTSGAKLRNIRDRSKLPNSLSYIHSKNSQK